MSKQTVSLQVLSNSMTQMAQEMFGSTLWAVAVVHFLALQCDQLGLPPIILFAMLWILTGTGGLALMKLLTRGDSPTCSESSDATVPTGNDQATLSCVLSTVYACIGFTSFHHVYMVAHTRHIGTLTAVAALVAALAYTPILRCIYPPAARVPKLDKVHWTIALIFVCGVLVMCSDDSDGQQVADLGLGDLPSSFYLALPYALCAGILSALCQAFDGVASGVKASTIDSTWISCATQATVGAVLLCYALLVHTDDIITEYRWEDPRQLRRWLSLLGAACAAVAATLGLGANISQVRTTRQRIPAAYVVLVMVLGCVIDRIAPSWTQLAGMTMLLASATLFQYTASRNRRQFWRLNSSWTIEKGRYVRNPLDKDE